VIREYGQGVTMEARVSRTLACHDYIEYVVFRDGKFCRNCASLNDADNYAQGMAVGLRIAREVTEAILAVPNEYDLATNAVARAMYEIGTRASS